MTPAQKAILRAMARGRSKAELTEMFALIRARSDRTLLAALKTPKKRAAKKAGDPVVKEVDLALRKILGPSAEKAELLVEHMARKHRVALSVAPKGVADGVRRLRPHFSDAQIRAGAKSLLAEIAGRYSKRETVV
ncbi:MAG: hypothetical protein WDM79_15900 [Terricaulis sp.]